MPVAAPSDGMCKGGSGKSISAAPGDGQYARALRALGCASGSDADSAAVARALMGAPARVQYDALSRMREGGARETLQRLLALPVTQATTLAAARAAAALASTPELPCTVEVLTKRPPTAWTRRAACLVGVCAGPAARDALCWTDVFARLAEIRDTRRKGDNVPPDVAAEEKELAAAVAAVLRAGNTDASILMLPPARSWSEQDDVSQRDDEICGCSGVSLWRELVWADFASRAMRGEVDPGDVHDKPACLLQPDVLLDTLDPSAAAGVVRDIEYAVVQDVRIRRRRRPCSCEIPESDETGDVPMASEAVHGPAFVETEGVCDAKGAIARALADAMPVMLEGPSGCGKSHLLTHIARAAAPVPCSAHPMRGQLDNTVVRVQMDSVLGPSGDDEFASLVGAVVPLPGGKGFRWRPGPIGLALLHGFWLILENFDSGSVTNSASPAVTGIVSRLATARAGDDFHAPGRGIPITVARGFALFASRTVHSPADGTLLSDWEPPGLWASWRQVRMPQLLDSELAAILSERFPSIADCTGRVLASIANIRNHMCGIGQLSSSSARVPNMREAVKLCVRLESLRAGPDDTNLTPETAAMEAMDVLCLWDHDGRSRAELVACIASAWSLPAETVRALASSYVPAFSNNGTDLHIGRTTLPFRTERLEQEQSVKDRRHGKLALTGHTLRLMERIGRAVQMGESVCLSGESGCGKTACVQELALRLGKELVIVNMSRSSDIGDLLGGFRPVDMRTSVASLARKFEDAFCRATSREKNERFLRALRSAARSSTQVLRALKLMRGAVNALPNVPPKSPAEDAVRWTSIFAELGRLEQTVAKEPTTMSTRDAAGSNGERRPVKKRKRVPNDASSYEACEAAGDEKSNSPVLRGGSSGHPLEFQFADGALVSAMRRGEWILLDEINLAPTEVLERLVGLLDERKLVLSNIEGELVPCASGFALFAAMNPPTDAGKKPLPQALRARFTELFVHDLLSKEDLTALVMRRLFGTDLDQGMGRGAEERRIAEDVSEFYVSCRRLADDGHLSDGNGKQVRYSLRSLSRLTDYAASVFRRMVSDSRCLRRALYEGAQVAFVTPLPRAARSTVEALCSRHLLALRGGSRTGRSKSVLTSGSHRGARSLEQFCDVMRPRKGISCTSIAGFHVECRAGSSASVAQHEDGFSPPAAQKEENCFIVTEAVEKTLEDVCRALVVGAPRLPILLQGPTGAGKTSLVAHIARKTGKKLLRINNHEHTDVAEYLGGYVATEDGSLQFREGPIVRAARHGDWIVLDELNLAPVEVLEALNRLLDDNREIRIPETGEVVPAAPGFTIFATQNPPGLYGGRKELSRAFRGRFVEILVDDLPDEDLREILGRKARLPASFAERMIAVMRDLQVRRRSSHMFLGKNGFVSARDLFRWASRSPRCREDLAVEGFFLLGERARLETERDLVRRVILKHVGVEPEVLADENLYQLGSWTPEQLASDSKVQFLHQLRASADAAGIALTPSMRRMLTLVGHSVLAAEPVLLVGSTGCGKTTVCSVVADALKMRLGTVNCHRHSEASDFVGSFRPAARTPSGAKLKSKLFHWVDGPLVEAMKLGHAFLIDEINMADDAVAERLNSVLEVERTLLLSEKGGTVDSQAEVNSTMNVELVTAASTFRVFATMNPGGDFGKKELSPALRNRFTEIWVPVPDSREEFSPVVDAQVCRSMSLQPDSRLEERLRRAGESVVDFVDWTRSHGDGKHSFGNEISSVHQLTLRDVAAWTEFIVVASVKCSLDPLVAFAHGARLVFLDGVMVGSTRSVHREVGHAMWLKVLDLIPEGLRREAEAASFADSRRPLFDLVDCEVRFGPFSVQRTIDPERGSCLGNTGFSFEALSSMRNSARLARAMALEKRPILLEGPPGSGKSSVVEALAMVARRPCARVNLSEHTEMSDLVGGYVPASEPGTFSFRLGPLIIAMKHGHWILLDELNLASQSVLEGLNCILDHRCALFVPELGQEIVAAEGFRVFGAQNSAHEGGGRRGLPRSFLNRFTRVAVEAPNDEDIELICASTHPAIDRCVVEQMVKALRRAGEAVDAVAVETRATVHSANLRDALRWCDLVDHAGDGDFVMKAIDSSCEGLRAESFFDAVLLQRLPNEECRRVACAAFNDVFGCLPDIKMRPALRMSPSGQVVRMGRVLLERGSWMDPLGSLDAGPISAEDLRALEALAFAVAARWPAVVTSGSECLSDSRAAPALIRKLATLAGQRVVDLGVGGGTDAADLLGGFVQSDPMREVQLAVALLLKGIDSALRDALLGIHSLTTAFHEDCDLHRFVCRLESLRTRALSKVLASSVRAASACFEELDTVVRVHSQNIRKHRKPKAESVELPGSTETEECLLRANSRLCAARKLSSSVAGSFEWRKSALVEAAEQGAWVLVSNADRCPAAVLDRLNPLLERPAVRLSCESDRASLRKNTGRLMLVEAPSNSDGSPVFLSPHPNFRIFFTVDARRGSRSGTGLSKALRNRSLEICLCSLASTAPATVHDSPVSAGSLEECVDLAWRRRAEGRQVPPAILEQGKFRVLAEARSLFAHNGATSLLEALEMGLDSIFGTSDQTLSDTHLRARVLSSVAKSEPRRTPLFPYPVLVASPDEVTRGRLSFSACRDICILRVLLETPRKHVPRACAKSLLYSEHQWNALENPTVDFASECELEPSCSNLDMCYIAESVVLASTSEEDLRFRYHLLQRELEYGQQIPGDDGTLCKLLLRALRKLLLVPSKSNRAELVSKVCSPPIDPILGLDEAALSCARRICEGWSKLEFEESAVEMRFHVSVFGRLLAMFDEIVDWRGDTAWQTPGAMPSCALLQSKLSCEGVALQVDGLSPLAEAIRPLLYPLVSTLCKSCQYVVWCSRAETTWQSCHVEWSRFFFVAAELLQFVSSSEVRNEDDLVRFATLIQLLCRTTPPVMEQDLSLAPLRTVMRTLQTEFPRWTAPVRGSTSGHCGLPLPRTERAQVTEESFRQIVCGFEWSDVGLMQRKSVVQALVTLSSQSAALNSSIFNTLADVARSLQSSLKCLKNECSATAAADGAPSGSAVDFLADLSALGKACSALVLWSGFLLAPSSRASLPSLEGVFANACAASLFSGRIGLSGTVPFQRLLWIVQSARGSSVGTGSLDDALSSGLSPCWREAMVSVLRCLLGCDDAPSRLSNNVAPSTPTEPIVLTESEVTVACLRQLSSTSLKGHLCNSSRDIEDASAIALSLLVGITGAASCGQGMLSQVGLLLAAALFDLCFPFLQDLSQHTGLRLPSWAHFTSRTAMDLLDFLSSAFFEVKCREVNRLRLLIPVVKKAMDVDTTAGVDDESTYFDTCRMDLGTAWTDVGVARLLAAWARVAEEDTLDPAKLALAEATEWCKLGAHARSRIRCYGEMASQRLGANIDTWSLPYSEWWKTIEDCREAASSLREAIVHRPADKHGFGALKSVVSRIVKSLVEESQVSGLLNEMRRIVDREALAPSLAATEEKERLVVASLKVALERLDFSGDLYHLRDVGGEFVLALREILFGVGLCGSSMRSSLLLRRPESRCKASLCKELMAFPRPVSLKLRASDSLFRLAETSCANSEVVLAVAHLVAEYVEVMGPDVPYHLFDAVANLVRVWKAEVVSKEIEDEKASSLYRLQVEVGRASSVVVDCEESEEDDFRETFNIVAEDDEGEPAVGLSHGDGREPANESGPVPQTSDGSPRMAKPKKQYVDGSVVWKLYSRVVDRCLCVAKNREFSVSSRLAIIERSLRVCFELACENSESTGRIVIPARSDFCTPAAYFAAAINSLRTDGASLASVCGSSSGSRDLEEPSQAYNFYVDSNTPEALRGARALSSLIDAVASVQRASFSENGEHPVLQGVGLAAERAARFASSRPLSVMVVGFESVLRKADEWQRHFALHGMRMDKEVREVASVASRWRKLEMQSWPQLIESRVLAFKNRAEKWFPYLHDVLFRDGRNPVKLSGALMSTLDQFLRASPCGEFETRCILLRYFAHHVAFVESSSPLADSGLSRFLFGLFRFYSQFMEGVHTKISSARAPLESKMKEYASLARWDKEGDLGSAVKLSRERDQSLEYYRLKSASENMRRKLHKICREVDSSLREPVSEVVACSQQGIGYQDLSQCAALEVGHDDERILSSLTEEMTSLCAVPFLGADDMHIVAEGRLGRLPDLAARMRSLAERVFEARETMCDLGVRVTSRLREIVRNRVSLLRKSTKPDIQAKSKALADLFKALRGLGLSPHLSTVPAFRKQPDFWLTTPELGLTPDGVSHIACERFYRVARKITRLLEVSSGTSLNSDLSRRDRDCCLAFSAHLFDTCVSDRFALCDALAVVRSISELSRTLADCSSLADTENRGKVSETARVLSSMMQVNILLDAEVRLPSLLEDVTVAAKLASSTVNSGHRMCSTLRRESSLASDRNRHILSTSLEPSRRVAEILVRATSTLRDCIDEAGIGFRVSRRGSTSELILTFCELKAALCMIRVLEDLKSRLSPLLREAESVSCGNVATLVLRDAYDYVCETLAKVQDRDCCPESSVRNRAAQDSRVFSLAENVINAALVGAQGLSRLSLSRSTAPSPDGSDEDVDVLNCPKALTDAHSSVFGLAESLNLKAVLASVRALKASASTQSSWMTPRQLLLVRVTARFVGYFLKIVVSRGLTTHIMYHVSSLSLADTLLSLFNGLCTEGFCRPKKEAPDDPAEENLQSQDGTGFGDVGDGDASLAQDVSDQIEHEEQLLGLQSDRQAPVSQDASPNYDDVQDSTGVEMSNDFDGEIGDMPESEGDPGREDAEEDGSSPEKIMGDSEHPGAEQVDERLWDADDNTAGDEDRSNLEKGEDVNSAGMGPEVNLVAREADDDDQLANGSDTKETKSDARTKDKQSSETGELEDVSKEDETRKDMGKDTELGDDERSDGADEEKASGKAPKLKFDDPDDEERVGEEEGSLCNGDDKNHRVEGDDESRTDSPEADDTLGSEAGQDEALSGNAIGETASLAPESKDSPPHNATDSDAGLDPPSGGADFDDLSSTSDAEDNLDHAGDMDNAGEGSDNCSAELDLSGDNDESEFQGVKDDTVSRADNRPEALNGREPGNEAAGSVGCSGEVTAATQAEHKPPSMAQDVPLGVAGGSNMLIASNALENEEDPGSCASRSKESLNSNENASGEALGGDSERFATGNRTADDQSGLDNAAHPEPNPLRDVGADTLLSQWEKRLRLLRGDADPEAGNSGKEEQNSWSDNTTAQFISRSDLSDQGRASGADEHVALGAATAEQHKPLPEPMDWEDEGLDGIDKVMENSADPVKTSFAGATARRDRDEGEGSGGDRQCVEDAESGLEHGDDEEDDPSVKDAEKDIANLNLDGNGDLENTDNPKRVRYVSFANAKDRNLQSAAGLDAMSEDEGMDVSGVREMVLDLLSNGVESRQAVEALSRLWQRMEFSTSADAANLCELLRLVLEPTLATGLAGDFRSGRRLNMRRVIEFVASDYRRDRIWMRRVRPEKRTYDVLIAIDDSESMADSGAGPVALQSLCLLCSALAKLEVGRIAVATFGSDTRLVRDFDEPLPVDSVAGGRLLSRFTFSQRDTDVKALLDAVCGFMCQRGQTGDGEEVKLAFIVSDGRMSEREQIRRKVRKMQTSRVLVACIVIDVTSEGKKSIFDVQRVEYGTDSPGKLTVTPYMDEFPVDFYAVVDEVSALPMILGDALRQWFEILQAS